MGSCGSSKKKKKNSHMEITGFCCNKHTTVVVDPIIRCNRKCTRDFPRKIIDIKTNYTSSSSSKYTSSSLSEYTNEYGLSSEDQLKITIPNGFQDEITQNEKDSCVICYENKKCCLLLPCSHLCLCLTCVNVNKDNIENGKFVCPLCRTNIDSINVAYY